MKNYIFIFTFFALMAYAGSLSFDASEKEAIVYFEQTLDCIRKETENVRPSCLLCTSVTQKKEEAFVISALYKAGISLIHDQPLTLTHNDLPQGVCRMLGMGECYEDFTQQIWNVDFVMAFFTPHYKKEYKEFSTRKAATQKIETRLRKDRDFFMGFLLNGSTKESVPRMLRSYLYNPCIDNKDRWSLNNTIEQILCVLEQKFFKGNEKVKSVIDNHRKREALIRREQHLKEHYLHDPSTNGERNIITYLHRIKGLKQSEIAQKLYCSPTTISNLVGSVNRKSPKVLSKLYHSSLVALFKLNEEDFRKLTEYLFEQKFYESKDLINAFKKMVNEIGKIRPKTKKTCFISRATNDDDQDIQEFIIGALNAAGIHVICDTPYVTMFDEEKRNAEYLEFGTSIDEFMHKIFSTDFVLKIFTKCYAQRSNDTDSGIHKELMHIKERCNKDQEFLLEVNLTGQNKSIDNVMEQVIDLLGDVFYKNNKVKKIIEEFLHEKECIQKSKELSKLFKTRNGHKLTQSCLSFMYAKLGFTQVALGKILECDPSLISKIISNKVRQKSKVTDKLCNIYLKELFKLTHEQFDKLYNHLIKKI